MNGDEVERRQDEATEHYVSPSAVTCSEILICLPFASWQLLDAPTTTRCALARLTVTCEP